MRTLKIFIIGAGKSGLAVCSLVEKLGHETVLFDDATGDITDALHKIDASDLIILSPGVPQENPLVLHAKKQHKNIKSELEFAFDLCKAPTIAITGTNGKTTTTALTAHLLSGCGSKATSGGNIGVPFSSFCTDLSPQDFAVIEVSSFMLESVKTLKPFIAALLNITPDHLDRHKNMDSYKTTKMQIFKHQTPHDFAVLNLDDPVSAEYLTAKEPKIAAQKFYFSALKATNAAHLRGHKIFFDSEYICDKSDLKILGNHNTENALAAVTMAKLAGASTSGIAEALTTFSALPHRLELVASTGSIKFYNDSKATNIDSTLKAVHAVGGYTALILGGSDKGYDYEELFKNLPPHIAHCAILGEVTQKLTSAATKSGYKNFTVCHSLPDAVKACFSHCEDNGGGNILLSPAAASFDMFRDYIERGEAFTKIARGYVKKE